ncbi:MAG: serine/threonine-protein kinase, partial [Planctomycetota bacterium]
MPADAARSADSKLRLVSDDALFPEPDLVPDDESPTIISKLPKRGDSHHTRDSKDLRGRKLGHFELIEPIGVGGMAAVLRARDTQLDRFVALKILPPDTARDPENIRRFHQEARAAAKLDHENIARVFFCGEDQGLHFISFEFVEGDNLRKILERRGILPVGEAIRYVLQVATGLEHAASRGVVHRDIKPSNIIIMPDGRAKVVDMGLARSLEPHADNGLTQSGVTLGTFDYISPEQALEPREADCRSDIYSLGCTFYHMLTGNPPVPEGTAAKKLQHHQHVAPTDPRQLNPDIPDDVARVLGRMMAKDPRDRYQRPIHIVHDLLRCSSAMGDDSSPHALHFDLSVPAPPERRPMLLVALAGVALAAVLILLSFAPNSQVKRNLQPPKANGQPKNPPALAKAIPEPATPKSVAPSPAAIRTEDDLQRALDRTSENERVSIALDGDIALSGKLKVAGAPGRRPMIEIVGSDRLPARLILAIDQSPLAPLAGFRIDDANISFRNVRFEIIASDGVKKLDVPVAAVSVSGGSIVDFEQCSFAQTGLPTETTLMRGAAAIPAASLLVNAAASPSGETAKVTLRECYFPTGQAALAMVGSAKVSARDCAFMTLGNLVHLRSGEPIVALEHCSAYLSSGSAIRIDNETSCRLKVDYCIFSVPEKIFRSGEKPNLLVQTDSADRSRIVYQGQSNRYHNLNSLWLSGGSHLIGVDDLNAFREAIASNNGYDRDSLILPQEPAPFLLAGKSDKLPEAFQLQRNQRDLQLPREKYDLHPLIGIRKCMGFAMPRLAPLAPDGPIAASDYKPAPNEKVVDPEQAVDAPGLYDSLAKAIAAANPGDIITLRAGSENAPFLLKPTDLEADLTVRGFPGTFPTLTLADTRISDAALFRLLDGTLQLENLHLLLEPNRDGFVSQSIVAVVGAGTANIKNCTITMKPRDRANPRQMPLSVVTALAGEDVKMMMNDARPALPTPVITLQDSFVRGDGDFVTLRGSRAANVKVTKSLLFLGGSLVHQVQAATKESASPDAPIAVRMKDSAFFFVDPLLWLKAGKLATRHQHPLRVEQADNCLFASLTDRPIAYLEGPEASEKTLAQLFEWKGQGNAFVHFDTAYLLEYVPAEDALRTVHIDETSWKETIERDGDARFLPMGFKTLPACPLALRSPEDALLNPEAVEELQPYMAQLPRFHMPK